MPYGIDYCRNLLNKKRSRNQRRYKFYEMKNIVQDMMLVKNTKIRNIRSMIGWCPKAVDSLADRLIFKGWKDDSFDLTQIFQMNNPDIFFDSCITSALITGCAFVYISLDDTGFPRLEVIDGCDATGVVDPVTNLLIEGYAVLSRNKFGQPEKEAYFLPGSITIYEPGFKPYVIENSAPYPLLVPIIYRPDAKRPLGHSRISRANMAIVEGAIRTIKRSEISAEFYSFPQKYVIGLSQDSERLDSWRATMSAFLQFDKDDDGDKPQLGQFSQQSMSPYTEQLRTFAALFAGENGLTLDDLGFVSDNPSSAEAIKASHETLRQTARKAQRTFGACFLNVGYLAACLRDDFPYQRRQFYLTKPLWEPIFEPDASTLTLIGDGAIKLNQAIPGYFDRNNLAELIGIEPGEEPIIPAEETGNE